MGGKKTFPFMLAVFFCFPLFLTDAFAQPAGRVGKDAAPPGQSCEEALREANNQCYRGNCGASLPVYDRLIDQKTSCPNELKGDVYFGRGRAKEAERDYRGAVADYRKAYELRPDSRQYREALGQGYYLLANQKERLGDYRGALEDYRQALDYKSDSQEAAEGIAGLYYLRGVDRERRGELKNALEEFNQALRYKPHYREALEAKKNLEERIRNKAAERDGMFTF